MTADAIQHPKVVVFGAGSLFFGRQAIWQMICSPHLNKGTLALMDTNLEYLRKLETLVGVVARHEGVALKIEASMDRRAVLPGADCVALSFANQSVRFRGIDCAVSEKYGIRMCSGDSIGPGGIFRTLRELPEIVECARDIERICPDAWTINYINPSATNGIGLRRFAPGVKSFALCDGLHMPHIKKRFAVRAGIVEKTEQYSDEIDNRFDLRIAGVNHFTWALKAEFDGRDVTAPIAESLRSVAATETDGGDKGAKAKYNSGIGHALYEVYGRIPCCVAHTKEYVRFWQGLGRSPEPIPPLSIWETDARYKRHEAVRQQVDDFISGAIPIGEFVTTIESDHATDVIENMAGGLGKPFYVNTFNQGAVTNMADDAYLELLCDVDTNGPKPRPAGDFPRGLRGLQEQVLDAHELAAQAAMTCDRTLLRRAMLSDPLASPIADADHIVAELLQTEREALPKAWFE